MTSDEKPAVRCAGNRHISRLRCSGSYCDDVFIICGSFVFTEGTTRFNTFWVENDGHKVAECARNAGPPGSGVGPLTAVASGIACSGDNCDNIQLECSILRDFRPDLSSCRTFANLSEESDRNTVNLARNEGIVSIACSGRHCDDKDVTICPLVPR